MCTPSIYESYRVVFANILEKSLQFIQLSFLLYSKMKVFDHPLRQSGYCVEPCERLHGCCPITSFSNGTGDIVSRLLLRSCKRPGGASASHPGPSLPRGGVCLERFARNRGKGGGESYVCAAVCPLKEKLYERAEAFCSRAVWIYIAASLPSVIIFMAALQ